MDGACPDCPLWVCQWGIQRNSYYRLPRAHEGKIQRLINLALILANQLQTLPASYRKVSTLRLHAYSIVVEGEAFVLGASD